MVSPAKDTGFATQELFVAKLELVLVIRHSGSCSLFPSLQVWILRWLSQLPSWNRNSGHLEKGTQGLETLRHGHRRLQAAGSHPSFPSRCFYIFLETHSILLPSSLQLTHDLRGPESLNLKLHLPFVLLHLISLDEFTLPNTIPTRAIKGYLSCFKSWKN